MTSHDITASTRAGDNARKIGDILRAESGYADLYRTCEAGPSGQRRDLLVARVRYLAFGPDDFEIVDVTGTCKGERAGLARRTTRGDWATCSVDHDGGVHLEGHASSLAVACDVVINGVHAATGRHDSRRISGSFRPLATKDNQ